MSQSDIALFPHAEDRYAGFVSRAFAFIVDFILVLLINIAVSFSIRAVLGFFGLNNLKVVSDFSASRLADGIALIFPFFLQAAYFIGAWSIFGRTLGMAVIGIRMEETDRPGSVTLTRAILRYLGMYVSFIPFALGFLWVLVDGRRQGWHDKLGNTVVVYSRTARRYHLKRVAAQQSAKKSEKIAARSIMPQ